ncbi:hypothetical protein [Paenibacillus sp. TY11]|uniref:hypothetical protein n=1 Tax=Paenibacillus sp. TY11 TaxID=3448633 RepID=UPI004039F146
MFNQSIAVLPDSKEWDQKFLFGYEDGRDSPALRLNNKEPYYATKAVQMNEQAFKNYSIEVDKGKPFSTDDFVNKNNKEIPILLGSEYEEKYHIGDRITANYLMKDFTLVVKGFIQSNTLVYNSQFPQMYLDRYIVMPAQEFPSPVNDDEFSFQKKHYHQLINGHIFSPENEYVVQNKLEEIKDISVHLISGASMNQLLSYYVAEVISIILLPGILFLILYKFFVDFLLSSYFLLILSCLNEFVSYS